MATTKNNAVTGLRFPEETLNKLKYIAWYDRQSFTDLVLSMSDDKIKKFEKSNGEITEDQLAKAKIK